MYNCGCIRFLFLISYVSKRFCSLRVAIWSFDVFKCTLLYEQAWYRVLGLVLVLILTLIFNFFTNIFNEKKKKAIDVDRIHRTRSDTWNQSSSKSLTYTS